MSKNRARGYSQSLPSLWFEDHGSHNLLAGRSLAGQCEPHFHETYSVAYVRKGTAAISGKGEELFCEAGTAFFLNPFEIAACNGSDDFDYDICYPPREFMTGIARLLGDRSDRLPSFTHWTLKGPRAAELGDILASARHEGRASNKSLEDALTVFLVSNAWLLAPGEQGEGSKDFVGHARDLIAQLINQPIAISDISRRVHASRSYFARSFRHSVGLPPSDYVRQLRLARGLEYVRQGHHLVEAALFAGFADQAHFTREFKRFYGTTPGKLAKDIGRSR